MEIKLYDSPQRALHRRKNLERVIDERGMEDVYRLYPEYAHTIDEIYSSNIRLDSNRSFRVLRPTAGFFAKSFNVVDRMFKFTATRSKNG